MAGDIGMWARCPAGTPGERPPPPAEQWRFAPTLFPNTCKSVQAAAPSTGGYGFAQTIRGSKPEPASCNPTARANHDVGQQPQHPAVAQEESLMALKLHYIQQTQTCCFASRPSSPTKVLYLVTCVCIRNPKAPRTPKLLLLQGNEALSNHCSPASCHPAPELLEPSACIPSDHQKAR